MHLGPSQEDESQGEGVLASVSVFAKEQSAHEVCWVSSRGFTDRERRDGGGVQNGIQSAFEMFRDDLEEGERPSHCGPTSDPIERSLARSASELSAKS